MLLVILHMYTRTPSISTLPSPSYHWPSIRGTHRDESQVRGFQEWQPAFARSHIRIVGNPDATSTQKRTKSPCVTMVWERPWPWKRGRSLWMQTALYLLPFPMLMMQHFVVCLSCGLRPLTCLLRRSTTATLAVCSMMSVAVGGPQAVPNPRCSRLTKKPQRSASRSQGWYSGGPRPASWLWMVNSVAHGMLRSHGAWRIML